MSSSPGAGARLPADRCPYAVPFPDAFAECGAYSARREAPTDSRHQPLTSVWTCSRLTVGGVRNRFYPRCAIGTAEDRRHWILRECSDRVSVVDALRAKAQAQLGDLLEALAVETDAAAADRLRALAVDHFRDFCATNSGRLRSGGLDAESLTECLRQTLAGYVHGSGAPIVPTPALLAGASWPLVLWFRPDLLGSRPAPSGQGR